jgi:hypothetical protein
MQKKSGNIFISDSKPAAAKTKAERRQLADNIYVQTYRARRKQYGNEPDETLFRAVREQLIKAGLEEFAEEICQ